MTNINSKKNNKELVHELKLDIGDFTDESSLHREGWSPLVNDLFRCKTFLEVRER